MASGLLRAEHPPASCKLDRAKPQLNAVIFACATGGGRLERAGHWCARAGLSSAAGGGSPGCAQLPCGGLRAQQLPAGCPAGVPAAARCQALLIRATADVLAEF